LTGANPDGLGASKVKEDTSVCRVCETTTVDKLSPLPIGAAHTTEVSLLQLTHEHMVLPNATETGRDPSPKFNPMSDREAVRCPKDIALRGIKVSMGASKEKVLGAVPAASPRFKPTMAPSWYPGFT
jgi:hypothetical protein